MAGKSFISVRVDDRTLEEVKAIAERNGWKFQKAFEIATEQFVNKYKTYQIPGLELLADEPGPAEQMAANGAAALFPEAA